VAEFRHAPVQWAHPGLQPEHAPRLGVRRRWPRSLVQRDGRHPLQRQAPLKRPLLVFAAPRGRMITKTQGRLYKSLDVGSPAPHKKQGSLPMQDLLDEIQSLKKAKNATILAHYYQEGDIQDLADFTGDSLKLARAATKVQTEAIVFCGVHFMAETAKMLNPAKRVLLPDLEAGCSLAESCPADKLERFQEMLRANGRQFQTVTYINSTAKVKALSDWVVTSRNAEEIIPRVPQDFEILFVPDRHLGQYLQEVTGRPMILWNGSCIVHEVFSVGDLLDLKKKLPHSITLAHPECPANIREH